MFDHTIKYVNLTSIHVVVIDHFVNIIRQVKSAHVERSFTIPEKCSDHRDAFA